MALYVGLYRLSGGILGGQLPFGKVLLLDSVGRKTGKKRTNPVMYIRDGENFIISASAGGAPKNPGWYYNLMAMQHTTIQVRGKKIEVQIEEASPEKRAILWKQLTAQSPQFKAYEKITKRTIPMLILKP